MFSEPHAWIALHTDLSNVALHEMAPHAYNSTSPLGNGEVPLAC